MEKIYKPKDILDLFEVKNISKQSLLNYENNNELPKAHRLNSKIPTRYWETSQLPEIGEKLGYLKKPTTPKIFTTYSQKGSGLKTTLTFEFARLLALHNIKTICVGLDSQMSLSRLLKKEDEITEISQLKNTSKKGLYHFLYENADIDEVIQKTDLPSLYYINETPELTLLQRKLQVEATRKEYVFDDKLIPKILKKGFQVIIYDASPTWGNLVEAAITSSQFVLNPLETLTGGYYVLDYNIKNVFEYSEAIKQKLLGYFLIPTLEDGSKLSKQIMSHYMTEYEEYCVPYSVRRSIVGAEAGFLNKSCNEYKPTHPLSEDYRKVVQYVWSKALETEKTQ